jgi:hypothetical protein
MAAVIREDLLMSAPTTIPVTISPEAAERLAELGMQAELERMLEHTRQTVPGVYAIRVVLRPVYDCYENTGIQIEAVMEESSWDPEDRTWWEWGDWLHQTFPPQVTEHFEMWLSPEKRHEG